MIIVGTASVNGSTQKVELIAPLGFGTARGIRLSNYSQDSLILTNISGVDQSQEYLAPQTQMVYATANVGTVPTVVGYSQPPTVIAASLLVEWSTDPDNDFTGTYPAALPTSPSVSFDTKVVAPNTTIPFSLSKGTQLFDVHSFQSVNVALGFNRTVGNLYYAFYDSAQNVTARGLIFPNGFSYSDINVSYSSWLGCNIRVLDYYLGFTSQSGNQSTMNLGISGANSNMGSSRIVTPQLVAVNASGITASDDSISYTPVPLNTVAVKHLSYASLGAPFSTGPLISSGNTNLPAGLIAGEYQLALSCPSDAVFTVWWNGYASYSGGIAQHPTPGTYVFPIATSGEGVVIDSTRYITKPITLPLNTIRNPISNGLYTAGTVTIDISTAAASADNAYVTLTRQVD